MCPVHCCYYFLVSFFFAFPSLLEKEKGVEARVTYSPKKSRSLGFLSTGLTRKQEGEVVSASGRGEQLPTGEQRKRREKREERREKREERRKPQCRRDHPLHKNI